MEDKNVSEAIAIADLLKKAQEKHKITVKELKWDDYIFETKIGWIKFRGRFFTRNAMPGTVSKYQIFKEHLNDFRAIIFYCFFHHIPYVYTQSVLKLGLRNMEISPHKV